MILAVIAPFCRRFVLTTRLPLTCDRKFSFVFLIATAFAMSGCGATSVNAGPAPSSTPTPPPPVATPTPTPVASSVNIPTWHMNNSRTGLNNQETQLTPANVNSSSFGKLFSYSLDGYAYAQPLYISNLAINGASHNVVFVAT